MTKYQQAHHSLTEDATCMYDFYSELVENDVVFTYTGDFSPDLISAMLSFAERKVMTFSISNASRKKIFNVMVEVLQNICKHQDVFSHDELDDSSCFFIVQDKQFYRIISRNPIANKHVKTVTDKINHVNKLDRVTLKKHHKDRLINNEMSAKSGAGVGFIDMALKSDNKLDYSFEPINDEYSQFMLSVNITIG